MTFSAEDIAFERAAAWLAQRNRDLPPAQRLLPAALLLKAVALALQRYPEFNGFYRDGAFAAAAGIHLGVAIALREGGLVECAIFGRRGSARHGQSDSDENKGAADDRHEGLVRIARVGGSLGVRMGPLYCYLTRRNP